MAPEEGTTGLVMSEAGILPMIPTVATADDRGYT
jgi:hypothetical protein